MLYGDVEQSRESKEQKSRRYRELLDEQIKQNRQFNIKHQGQSRRRHSTIAAVAENQKGFTVNPKIHNQVQELSHQSIFLPIIHTTKNIKESGVSNNHQSRMNFSKRYKLDRIKKSKKQRSFTMAIQETSDEELQKCLYECEQLLKDANGFQQRNYVPASHQRDEQWKRLRNELSSQQPNFDRYQISSPNQRHFQPNHSKRIETDLRKTGRKRNLSLGTQSIASRAEKQPYTLSIPRQSCIEDEKGSNFKHGNEVYGSFRSMKQNSERGIKTLRRDSESMPHSGGHNRCKTQSANSSYCFEDREKQLIGSFKKPSKLKQSDEGSQRSTKKQKESKLLYQSESLQMDRKILQNLRKIKIDGGVLFKKIDHFKKQREGLTENK